MSFAAAPVATPQRARMFTAGVAAAAVGAAAAGTVALVHGAARDQTTTLAAVTLLAALSFVGSGLVAWRRRPEVWTGALMVAAGFCMLASSLANFNSAVPFTIGLVVAPVGAAVIAHLVLSFPDGRLHFRPERVVVAGAYVVTIPLQVVMLMFMGFENVTGCPCPTNLLFVKDDMATHSDEGCARRRRSASGIPEQPCSSSRSTWSPATRLLLADSAEGIGYLLKDRVSDVKDFTAAARRVASGGTALDPEVVSRLVGRRKGTGPLEELSPLEREMLELMAEGRSNQGIAERLVITERAVEKHITNIFGKLNLPAAPADHRRVLAVLAYLKSQRPAPVLSRKSPSPGRCG